MHRWLGRAAQAAAGLIWCGLWLAAADAVAQEDPPGRVGRLAAIQGEVFVYDDELGEWQAAQHNRPLTRGDRLSTAGDARAELRIGSTTLHLGSSAELDIVRLDDERLQFALLRGSLGLRVRSAEVAAELEVLSPEGRFVPLRSGLYRVDRQDEISYASVWRGELEFQAPGLSRTLQPGQRAELWRDGPQREARSQMLAPLDDAFAQLVLLSDQADTRSAATTFVSPEMTGVEDLDRFGGWQQHPEYGAVWAPATVAVGWVPYRYGQWVWLRPWGWTWVDDAPWGFAPFHYGRWVSWGGRWCWSPGPRVARPVYAPALVAWAGGPQFKVHMGSREVPAVGWVPLAPREHYRPTYRASPGYLNRLNAQPQLLGPPGAGYGNRHVPGAVTVLPTAQMTPRQPVAAAALRADEMQRSRPWQAERFQFDAPGRPPQVRRESTSPRATGPFGAEPRAANGTAGGAGAVPAIPGSAQVPWSSNAARPAREPMPQRRGQGDSTARPEASAPLPQPPQAQVMQPVPSGGPARTTPSGQDVQATDTPRQGRGLPPGAQAGQSGPATGPFYGRPVGPATPPAARATPSAATPGATPLPPAHAPVAQAPGAAPALAPNVAPNATPNATHGAVPGAVPGATPAVAPKPRQPPAAAPPTPPIGAAPGVPAPAAPPRPATTPQARTDSPNAMTRGDDPLARRGPPDSRQMQREK